MTRPRIAIAALSAALLVQGYCLYRAKAHAAEAWHIAEEWFGGQCIGVTDVHDHLQDYLDYLNDRTGSLRWITNRPGDPREFHIKPRGQSNREAWIEELEFRLDKVIGPPKASAAFSSEELLRQGMVGIYAWVGAEPNPLKDPRKWPIELKPSAGMSLGSGTNDPAR